MIWTQGRCDHCGRLNSMRIEREGDRTGQGKCHCSKRHLPGCRGTRPDGGPCRCRMLYGPHTVDLDGNLFREARERRQGRA